MGNFFDEVTMKKLIVVVIIIAVAMFTLTACSNTVTPAAAWADYETLTYDVLNAADNAKLGEMSIVTERSPGDMTLNGKEYSADGRVTFTVKTADVEMTSIMLFTRYSVNAAYKTYNDLKNTQNSYTLESRHDGKYYYYSLNGAEEKRLKTGTIGFTDSEFLYHYIRCYDPSSPPSAITVADPLSDSVIKLSCSAYGSSDVTVPFPDGTKNVTCTAISVSPSQAPKGKSIKVFITPDSSEYHVSGLSISLSKKIPVRIQEDDIVYSLTAIAVR